MPIERLRMRPWLENALNLSLYPGVEWIDEESKIFRLPWKHASRNGWQIQKDASLFQAWAEHTGKYTGNEEPNPKTWKANFRCALNSLPDMEELVDRRTTKGNNAFKVYKIITNAEKKTYSKKVKGRGKGKKRSFLRSRSFQKDTDFSKNKKPITEIQQSYKRNSKPTITADYEFPQELNGTTHLVDHDYALTRYFDLFNEATDTEEMKGFDVPDSQIVKTEPLSPNDINAEHEFSLYEESRFDSKNIKTSCSKSEEARIMSDDEVVELIDEMASECGSTSGSVHEAMEELLEGCYSDPFDTDFPDKTKRRANSAPGMLGKQMEPLTIFCPLPSKIPRSKSSTDIQSMLNTSSAELLQSCL